MNHCLFATAHGPLHLIGRLRADTRPALFVMSGFGGSNDVFHELVDWFPGASVLVAPFPGLAASTTPDWDVARMSRMVDEVIASLSSSAPVVACGASAGCLVTLGLRAPQIVRQVAVEPFFHTADLWPLHSMFRDLLAERPGATTEARAAKDLFGFTLEEAPVDRDFEGVLDGLSVPTDVLLGTVPLAPPRTMTGWPSLTGERDRELLSNHPHATLRHGPTPSGHHVNASPAGQAMFKALLHEALLSAAKLI